jgi:hypothetical protein
MYQATKGWDTLQRGLGKSPDCAANYFWMELYDPEVAEDMLFKNKQVPRETSIPIVTFMGWRRM